MLLRSKINFESSLGGYAVHCNYTLVRYYLNVNNWKMSED